jgi:hypothetical protein
MQASRAVAMCLVVAVAASSIQCSFVSVRKPRSATEPGRCESSRAAPVIDVGATLFLAAPLAYGAYNNAQDGGEDNAPFLIVIGIPLAVASLIAASSAIWGFDKTAECRAAKRHSQG